jgi:hypothetical protein
MKVVSKIRYVSGTWPSIQVEIISDDTSPYLVKDNAGLVKFISSLDLYHTQVEADEKTLGLLRYRLKNYQEEVTKLVKQINEIESSDGLRS